jgi:hypothetical protein
MIRERALDEFARADGFGCFAQMREFWRRQHGLEDFAGVLISWSAASLRVMP